MIACGCGVEFAPSPVTYSHTQVFDGLAILICFDCPACGSTRSICTHETFDEVTEEMPIAAE